MKRHKTFIKKRELTLIIVIVIVLLLFFSGYSIGKAYQNTNIQTNATLAKPILVVENNPTIEVNGENEKQYYNFKVKNSNEQGQINQIGLQYYIEILTKKQEAISFKLYKEDQEIELINNKTSNIIMEKDKLQEDNYKLEIIYDKTNNNSVDDIIQDVQIKVHSEQLKL